MTFDIGPADALRGRTLLVLEDEILIGMDLVDTFEEAGGNVLPLAQSVERGIELVRDHTIDIGLLDVSLPDGSGFEVARLLADNGVPFAFHSGHVTRGEAQEEFPDAGWIAKPAEPARLIEVLSKLLI